MGSGRLFIFVASLSNRGDKMAEYFRFLLKVETTGGRDEKVFLAVNKLVKLVSGNQC